MVRFMVGVVGSGDFEFIVVQLAGRGINLSERLIFVCADDSDYGGRPFGDCFEGVGDGGSVLVVLGCS